MSEIIDIQKLAHWTRSTFPNWHGPNFLLIILMSIKNTNIRNVAGELIDNANIKFVPICT